MNIDVCPDALRHELLNFEQKYQLTPLNWFLPLDLLYYNMNLIVPTLLILALLANAEVDAGTLRLNNLVSRSNKESNRIIPFSKQDFQYEQSYLENMSWNTHDLTML
jgi:hypothetical protein